MFKTISAAFGVSTLSPAAAFTSDSFQLKDADYIRSDAEYLGAVECSSVEYCTMQ